MTRRQRQIMVNDWGIAAFGADEANSIGQRVLRLLEETIETFQAAGGYRQQAHKLIDFVFAKPAGDLAKEIGGVGICILALAEAAGLSADQEEQRELDRILAKPIEYWRTRNAIKNSVGFDARMRPNLDQLFLTGRTYNAFRRNNLFFLDEICQMTEAQILRLPEVGRSMCEELKRALARIGLALLVPA